MSVRKLAKALAEKAAIEGYGGDGVTASIVLEGQQISGSGWYSDEAEADLVQKLIEWSESDV